MRVKVKQEARGREKGGKKRRERGEVRYGPVKRK